MLWLMMSFILTLVLGSLGALILVFSRQFYLYRAVPKDENQVPWLYLSLRAIGYLLIGIAAVILIKGFWFTK